MMQAKCMKDIDSLRLRQEALLRSAPQIKSQLQFIFYLLYLHIDSLHRLDPSFFGVAIQLEVEI